MSQENENENEAQVAAIRLLDILDQELWTLEAELTRHPTELAAEAEAVAEVGSRVEVARAALAAQEAEVAEGEKRLATSQRRRLRSQERLPYLTTASQVEAAQREIVAIVAQAEEIEEEVLMAMEVVEEKSDALAAIAEQHRVLLEALEERRAEWADERPGLEARSAVLTEQRVATEAAVSGEVMRFYRMGVRASAGRSRIPRGITSVEKDICTACGRHVPPRWQQEVRFYRAFYGCQGCKRLLTFDAEPPAEDAAD